VKLEKEKLLEMYEKMVRIRKFEMKVEELHIQGILPGLKHLYIRDPEGVENLTSVYGNGGKNPNFARRLCRQTRGGS